MTTKAALLVTASLVLAPTAAALGLLQPQSYLVGYDVDKKTTVIHGLSLLGMDVEKDLDALGVLRVKGPSLVNLQSILDVSGVVYAEKDATVRAAGAQWNGAQWDGAQWDGERGADAGSEWGHAVVRTPEAWSIAAGGRAVEVCVVDSGVDPDHPDLAANSWQGDGANGYNAIDGSAHAEDDAGHGTHVAGIVAAVRGNGQGVAGVSESLVMSAKVLDATGHGTVTDLAAGMVWCADHGADVALLALSVDAESQTLKRALDYLERHDVVVVASSGNGGCSGCVAYPARDTRVLAVSAIGKDRQPASFSSTGPQVDLAAPGVDVMSTFDEGAYASGSGTSQAAAWAAGAAALVREHRPDLNAAQVRAALKDGAADLGEPGRDSRFGAGLLDVHGALRAAEGK